MNDRIRLNGMVLSASPIGEYDRRVVLLTAERGRISAFARGARRPKSSLVAATNPFVFGGFEVYEGRDSYTLYAADVENYYSELTSDLELVWYGYYFLEIAEYFSLENNDERERLALLGSAFDALLRGKVPLPLIRTVFEFKTLVINGDEPNAFVCGECGREESIRAFSMERRSVICDTCRGKVQAVPLPSAVIKAMKYITVTPAKEVFSFLLKEESAGALTNLTREYYRRYVEHPFKSEDFLDL
ncbi:MAG: DNA repair protein RecO [Lachnospiraceae bacterium]|nr:DNA repair protein RecO [Lachnospiraceae bacterium]